MPQVTQGMEQQHGLLVAALRQSAARVLHQQRVAVVHRVAKLEREHAVSLQSKFVLF